MDLTQLIKHPELMDKDTLYDLRSLLALNPYYQTVRLLMLQNLYLMHDQSFDEELRSASIYMTNRKVIFDLVESAHYTLKNESAESRKNKPQNGNRTISLIDDFLDTMPVETETKKETKRKPTPADAAIDYVSYLLETETTAQETDMPQMNGQNLIDNFINKADTKILLKEEPEYIPQIDKNVVDGDNEEGYFTESLARIYTKQGRYDKALEIIKRLNLNYPKKNAYFADQIRFLEKLIINNKNKK